MDLDIAQLFWRLFCNVAELHTKCCMMRYINSLFQV